MLREAVRDIHIAEIMNERRRLEVVQRKATIRRVDSWLQDIENMLECDQKTVPEPLIKEIAGFLREVDPKLHRSLLRNRARETARVLDVLFDAQEHLLPGLSETA